jgi:hypothetical protein
MKTEKLGQESIFPITLRQIGENEHRPATEKDIQEGMFLISHAGMTKRQLIAKDMMSIANIQLSDVSENFMKKYIGLSGSYSWENHFKIGVVKYALELTDELLKQEAL